MKLAISSIAWTPAEDEVAATALAELGIGAIEIAPTVRWPTPLTVSEAEAAAYRGWWAARDIEIVAMQSLLYGRPDLALFGPVEGRAAMIEYLGGICRLAGWLGATRLVFGSPGNRRAGDRSAAERDDIAVEFFRAVGARAEVAGTVLCIEANPAEYGCDWVRSVTEAAALVRAVDHPGFGLHLDAGGMLLHGDSFGEVAAAIADPGALHFHASDPQLAPLGEGDSASPRWHADLAAGLRHAGYRGVVSLEMRRQAEVARSDQLRAAGERLIGWYGA